MQIYTPIDFIPLGSDNKILLGPAKKSFPPHLNLKFMGNYCIKNWGFLTKQKTKLFTSAYPKPEKG